MRQLATRREIAMDLGSGTRSDREAPPIQIKPCTEDKIPQVMQFIHQHWHAGHILSRDETLLRWQFQPGRGGTEWLTGLTVVLALVNGEIGGMLGFIPFDLNLKGITKRGAWLAQWVCVPQLRAYNVGFALMWQVQKLNYDALLGMGLSPAGARGTSALGFRPIPAIPRWVGVVDAAATQQLVQTFAPSANPCVLAQALLPYVIGSLPRQGSIRITPWADSLREAWDLFWTRSLAPCLVGPARDSPYLLWRYVQHPRFRYQIRVAHAVGDELLGLTVFRVETVQGHRAKVMRIVEFLASPPAHAPLAAALVEAAREQDVTFADFFCTCLDAGAGLEAVGFRRHAEDDSALPIPRHLHPPQLAGSLLSGVELLTKDLRQSLGTLADRSDVYITKSDSDQDRPN
jgi:hypothetical protein